MSRRLSPSGFCVAFEPVEAARQLVHLHAAARRGPKVLHPGRVVVRQHDAHGLIEGGLKAHEVPGLRRAERRSFLRVGEDADHGHALIHQRPVIDDRGTHHAAVAPLGESRRARVVELPDAHPVGVLPLGRVVDAVRPKAIVACGRGEDGVTVLRVLCGHVPAHQPTTHGHPCGVFRPLRRRVPGHVGRVVERGADVALPEQLPVRLARLLVLGEVGGVHFAERRVPHHLEMRFAVAQHLFHAVSHGLLKAILGHRPVKDALGEPRLLPALDRGVHRPARERGALSGDENERMCEQGAVLVDLHQGQLALVSAVGDGGRVLPRALGVSPVENIRRAAP